MLMMLIDNKAQKIEVRRLKQQINIRTINSSSTKRLYRIKTVIIYNHVRTPIRLEDNYDGTNLV